MTTDDEGFGAPPYDADAEAALLAACMASKNARIVARRQITGPDFYRPENEVLYDAMASLDRAGANVDLITIRAAVIKRYGAAGEDRASTPGQQRATVEAALIALAGNAGMPDFVSDYAAIVHGYALKRRLADIGNRIRQRANTPGENVEALAAEAVTWLTGARDQTAGDISALALHEVLDTPDDDPVWVIPDLLEKGDRLMLTGSEGIGKSAFARQIAVMAAAGLHPFTEAVIPPIKAIIIDSENKVSQVRRQIRPLVEWVDRNGNASIDPRGRVLIDCCGRIDITKDRGLSRVHQVIDAFQPDLVIMGPIYRMSPRALQTDDDTAPFLAAVDTVTARGCAVILEAHAGHATEGAGKAQTRSLRPRGSSSLLGWPEFGLGLRGLGGGRAELEPWRGHREQRAWPSMMRRAPGNRWVETYPDDRTDYTAHNPDPGPGDGTLGPETLL